MSWKKVHRPSYKRRQADSSAEDESKHIGLLPVELCLALDFYAGYPYSTPTAWYIGTGPLVGSIDPLAEFGHLG